MSLGFLDVFAAIMRSPTRARVAVAISAVNAANANMGFMLPRCHNSAMPTDAISTHRVRIQQQPFDVAKEIAALQAGDPRVGAVCSFVGTVRDRNTPGAEGTVQTLELEHYPGMTEKSIEAMVDAAFARFDILGARVVHRVGLLHPTDGVVLVAVTSAHRGQSFQACEFLMDYLKTQAPFWKKEQTLAGAHWVDARVSDDVALARWGIEARNA
jgi:molybdopterin synthase catalytic subunit